MLRNALHKIPIARILQRVRSCQHPQIERGERPVPAEGSIHANQLPVCNFAHRGPYRSRAHASRKARRQRTRIRRCISDPCRAVICTQLRLRQRRWQDATDAGQQAYSQRNEPDLGKCRNSELTRIPHQYRSRQKLRFMRGIIIHPGDAQWQPVPSIFLMSHERMRSRREPKSLLSLRLIDRSPNSTLSLVEQVVSRPRRESCQTNQSARLWAVPACPQWLELERTQTGGPINSI
jgi:hypothetical protein